MSLPTSLISFKDPFKHIVDLFGQYIISLFISFIKTITIRKEEEWGIKMLKAPIATDKDEV